MESEKTGGFISVSADDGCASPATTRDDDGAGEDDDDGGAGEDEGRGGGVH